MNWLNLETRMLHSPEFIGCEPAEQATWLKLMLYCASQENGGVVKDCAYWKCRRWQQTCGVTLAEVEAVCELWDWDGSEVVLWGYPADKEDDVKLKRDAGARGGRKKAENKINSSTSPSISESATSTQLAPALALCESATSTPPSETQNTSYGKERKGKEGNEKELSLSESASESTDFSDEVPTAAVGGMEVLAKRICGLRQEWSRIALSYSERQSIVQNAASLHSVSEDDWRTIRDYLRATIPEGRPAWQPRSRAKFVETIGDVLNYALEWQRRRVPGPTLSQVLAPVKVVSAQERQETMAEFKQVFGKVGA